MECMIVVIRWSSDKKHFLLRDSKSGLTLLKVGKCVGVQCIVCEQFMTS